MGDMTHNFNHYKWAYYGEWDGSHWSETDGNVSTRDDMREEDLMFTAAFIVWVVMAVLMYSAMIMKAV